MIRMKNLFSIIIFFCQFIFCKELEIGKKIPLTEHVLIDTYGNSLKLQDIKGKNGTLVIFSSNTCPWVIRWEGRYVEISEKYKKKGISIIAVNSNVSRFDGDESIEKMLSHAKKGNYNFTYAQDQKAKLAYAFGATKTPHVYLFDNKDKLVYRGAIDDNAREAYNVKKPYLLNAIDQLLAGKKIKKPISKAIGCSIKF
ncbi:MAG: thioredoxin family protein [Candidatus Marinimicrobia bacterium]|nr:thioredoxin family protein [Candidatus Neomarinimicrobiota bacterium]